MIELTLSVAEVNKILEALGEKPFVEVFQLISKIQQQAGAQLQGNDGQPANDPPQGQS